MWKLGDVVNLESWLDCIKYSTIWMWMWIWICEGTQGENQPLARRREDSEGIWQFLSMPEGEKKSQCSHRMAQFLTFSLAA